MHKSSIFKLFKTQGRVPHGKFVLSLIKYRFKQLLLFEYRSTLSTALKESNTLYQIGFSVYFDSYLGEYPFLVDLKSFSSTSPYKHSEAFI